MSVRILVVEDDDEIAAGFDFGDRLRQRLCFMRHAHVGGDRRARRGEALGHDVVAADLDGDEAATLGPTLALVTGALKRATSADLVHVHVFGERVRHLHFNLAPHRAGGQAQYVERPVPQPSHEDPLAEVMTHCVEHLADRDLDIDALAARANMSRRTFDRQFRARTGSSPLSWLIGQRVLHAQRLLETSSLDIDAVASACGFGDGVSMRPHFRRIVGVAPQVYRRAFSGR